MRTAWLAAAVAAFLIVPAARAEGYAGHGPFAVQADGSASLDGYEVGPIGERNRIFSAVDIAKFGASALVVEGTVATAEGADATLVLHDTPHATLLVENRAGNAVSFTLAPDVGAIPRGRWAAVGDERTTGALVVLGQGTWSKAGDVVAAELAAGERIAFRASVGGGDLGAVLSEGRLLADVHLGASVDIVRYTTAQVEASLSGGIATVRVAGAGRGQLLSVSAPRESLDPEAVAVDGTTRLAPRPTVEALLASGSGYVVFADAGTTEVVILDDLRAPIRIGRLGVPADALLAVGLAALTFVAATWVLARRRRA